MPVFQGSGSADLACRCGGSVLIRGYLPANFLAIRFRCAQCGAITVTPGLAETDILPLTATPIGANQPVMAMTAGVARGDILVSREAMAGAYACSRPRDPPDVPILLTRAMLEKAAADYDRLTGGQFAAHAAASPHAEGTDQGDYPFAWSVMRLRTRIDIPGWSWLHQDDDAMAAMYVTALHHLMCCWGEHPLLARIAMPLTLPDRFVRTITTLAMAKLLFSAGNRVGFVLSPDEVGLRFTTPTDEKLTLAVLSPEPLLWRQKDRRSPDTLRSAVIDALAAAQSSVNRVRPGIVVLSATILQPDFDQMVVDAIHAAFQAVGRRHRGVAAAAIVMPKVLQTGHFDSLGFGYAFYPILNPRFAGENPIRLGTA